MPIPPGETSIGRQKKRPAASEIAISSGVRPGSMTICAARTATVAGSTMRFGILRCSRSTTASAATTQRRNAAPNARPLGPKRASASMTRRDVATATAGRSCLRRSEEASRTVALRKSMRDLSLPLSVL